MCLKYLIIRKELKIIYKFGLIFLEIVLKKVCNLPIKVEDSLIELESDLSGLEIDNSDVECLYSN